MSDKTNESHKDIYRRAVEKWGIVAQIHMCSEEMSELNKELMKIIREGLSDERKTALIDELADVTIMLEQMIFCFDVEKDVLERKEVKLARLDKLIGGE